MDKSQKQKLINKMAVVIVFGVFLFTTFAVFNIISLMTIKNFFRGQFDWLSGFTDRQSFEERFYDGRSAYDIALPEARQWRSNATLSSISSGAEGEEGDYWKLIFISASALDARYIVEIRDSRIISVGEAVY